MSLRLNCVGILCALLTCMAGFAQKDEPTPLEKCRFITAADLSDAEAPVFGKYPTKTRETIHRARLDLTSSPIAKAYRTVLRQQMAEGPNYAGHYRLACWGCGPSCAMFAVVNLMTGKVATAREFNIVAGTHLAADDFLPGTRSDSWGFRYKKDNSLLVVVGAPDEEESRFGAYYFALQDEQLRLIHTTRVNKHCENVKP